MGKDAITMQTSGGPVVLHLDRAVAVELLQGLTQALEPHSPNVGDSKKKLANGKNPKGKK
ncbi:MAG TPA: hypothetical protein VKH81_12790 [Candidatus Angelobacter sp.]|nr:hypothetical protein [Candidatus Angelobacter sp.]